MKNKTIHSVINARSLARKLIDVDLNNEGVSLQIPNLVKMKFDKYLKEGLNSDTSEMSDEYIAKKAIEFVHSSRDVSSENTYMPQESKGDFSPKSFYDSCERILSKEERIGDCVGLTQVVKYLLDSKGLDVKAVPCKKHVALEVKINDESVPLETTVSSGYDYPLDVENPGSVNLVSVAACTSAICLELKADAVYRAKGIGAAADIYVKTEEMYDKALAIDSNNSNAYYNRGRFMFMFEEYDQIISDVTKAIKINPNDLNSYYIRGCTFDKLKKYDKALLDFEKYASASESNAVRVASTISDLKEKIKN